MAEMNVYVMKCAETDLVKIGIATDPQKRLRQIINGSGLSVTLEYTKGHEKADEVERNAHRLMKDCRRAGEWFKATSDQAIEAVVRSETAVMDRDWIYLSPRQTPHVQRPRR